jgi:hypothetical protein
VEGGHHDRAGPVVVVLIDGEEAVAEQRDQVAEARLAPVEVLGVADGDVVVRLGAEHEDDARVQQSQAEDRAVLFVGAEQERQRVVGDRVSAGVAEARLPRREPAAAAPLVGEIAGDPHDRVAGHHGRARDRRRRLCRGHDAGS